MSGPAQVNPVQTIQRAALWVRTSPLAFRDELADWLETAAADIWAHGPLCECGSACHECDDDAWQPHARRALALARRMLGDA